MSTPIEVLEVQRWMKDASCVGNKEANWFPEKPGRTPEVNLAIKICKDCLVKQECLSYAIAHPELLGIWGGITARKRASIRGRNK